MLSVDTPFVLGIPTIISTADTKTLPLKENTLVTIFLIFISLYSRLSLYWFMEIEVAILELAYVKEKIDKILTFQHKNLK